MNIIKLLLICLLPISSYSQIKLSQTNFDLGELSLLNSDIVDFDVKNISSEPAYLLRIEADQNTGFQYTSRTFNPGEKEGIRIKLNPTQKGKITQKVNFYFSNNPTPIEITLKADVKGMPKNDRTACPQFGSSLKPPTGKTQPVAEIQKFDLILYDSNSEDELAAISQNKVEKPVLITPEPSAALSKPSTQLNTRAAQPVRPERPERAVRPVKKKKTRTSPEERRNAPSLGTILFGKVESPIINEDTTITISTEEKALVQKPTKVDSTQPEVILQKDEINNENNLLDNSYKPNNIVFLIDASTSMREEQKMDILKKAMIELLEPLREIDFITIVTYSGEAKVVLPTSSGNFKQEIAQEIENLQADGSTNAVKGIKKAIQVGKANFLESGNNQIFLASDGAFNIGENNLSLRKKIRTNADQGLTITVLGIKNDNWTNKSLKEIADLGNGDLLKIKSMNDASKVLESMKKKAIR